MKQGIDDNIKRMILIAYMHIKRNTHTISAKKSQNNNCMTFYAGNHK